MRFFAITFIFVVFTAFTNAKPPGLEPVKDSLSIVFPKIIIKNIAYPVKVESLHKDTTYKRQVIVENNGKEYPVELIYGKGSFPYQFTEKANYEFQAAGQDFQKKVNPIPLWFSILPPLIAILIALLFREVFTALFCGLFIGTAGISFFQGENLFISLFTGIFRIVDTYIIESFTEHSHISIILFSILIGATVNLITDNGGMTGIVNKMRKYANSKRNGQFITWLLGILIFFDDYANTLVVGNTMRPVSDKLKISREKLAYIVDSTAAPVASIAFVTTWIGAELGYIQEGIKSTSIDLGAYAIFFKSLAYSFYPVFALLFIFFLVFFKKDFGPMYKAEQLAYNGDKTKGYLEKKSETKFAKGKRELWFNALIPIVVIVFGAISGLLYTGWDTGVWHSDIVFIKKVSHFIGNSNSYLALLWSSIGGLIVAIILTTSQRILNIHKTIESVMKGFKIMLPAIIILTLAWSLALLTSHLHTADFIVQILQNGRVNPVLIPALTFVVSALVSFSTGSSWGTMAILYPLILPAAWLICEQHHIPHQESLAIFLNVVSSVLAGSVFGDHCSPISDTTILSSLSASCRHIEHVRTQLPYALTVGLVSLLVGTIPAALGVSSAILFPVGIIILIFVVILWGKKVEKNKND